ncbi:putative bifunctional diguanylate cyclase/phosphodiesterase [Massilia yuzhufengensis]|uniref:PAS domain S-box-containing protein/diguanylate cyclase (GGDEF) domain-containing protein n=1 Tax=Massilia yuzhufengensis TaxID=1164594 RepID=A0A1I1V801_9BURK|nr:EAL domain-containing protein [Massilia yuzhufengensis]SFD77233.1 PAS domain S-box-containing protein/diguanylate cyclase (GGDEF) domain-containing protein [Massilia yuzhufengensis]
MSDSPQDTTGSPDRQRLSAEADSPAAPGDDALAVDGPGGEALDWLYRFVAAIELAPAVAVHSMDESGVIHYWNQACAHLFGIPARDALGRPFRELVSHIGHQTEFDAIIADIWQGGAAPPPRDWYVETASGRCLWVHSNHFAVRRGGVTRQVFCMEIDITARKQLETDLAQAARVFENAHEAIIMMDAEYRVQAVNRAFTTITGFEPGDIVGSTLASLPWGDGDAGFYQSIWSQVDGQDHWEGELPARRKDGASYTAWVALTTIRDTYGEPANHMVMLSDISERKRVEEQVRHQAEHDALTGLPNRTLFLDRMHHALATWRRQHDSFAVLFLDLDRFKEVNDNNGHQAGDAVLREVATRLRGCVRRVDTISRLGGDEFVMLLADIGGVDQAAHVAAAVMAAVSRPIEVARQQLTLSASIGVAICPTDGGDVDTLMHHADVAMYHAKAQGRSSFRFFSPEMNARVVERGELDKRLRQALERQEFVLEYQPELDVGSGRVIGMEALIRWRHPDRGLLLPHDFLQVAEECGLIVPIGEWVLREACTQARAWRDAGHEATVAVNLSDVQFLHGRLLDTVDDALAQSGLAPHCLDLEITEGALMQGDAGLDGTVAALRGRGVQLTVDRFGTGVASLSSLRRFPLSKLKIDRSFVSDIEHDPDDAALIPAIIAVARSLRLRVVAEGVETAEQLRFLRQHGCDEYQGFYGGGASSRPDFKPAAR